MRRVEKERERVNEWNFRKVKEGEVKRIKKVYKDYKSKYGIA